MQLLADGVMAISVQQMAEGTRLCGSCLFLLWLLAFLEAARDAGSAVGFALIKLFRTDWERLLHEHLFMFGSTSEG